MAKFGSFRGGRANGPEGGQVIDLPGLDELRRRFSGGGGGVLRVLVIAVVVLVVVFTSFFTVDPEEVGVVMRFGAFQRYAPPGLNFKIPLGVEDVIKVPVERQLKEEFGFRTERAGIRTEYQADGFDDESLMLTGDLNIADVEWVVQYRVTDPYKYLFRVRGVRETFRAMTEAVMREVVGDRTVNEVITVGRQELATLTEQQLQALADQYETGITVEQVVLQNVFPPEKVQPSFNAVNQAEQQRETLINTAQAQYNEVIPRARGRADRSVQSAEGYALERVNRARGEAERFNSLYGEYRRAPEVTRQRLYLETMADILPQAGRKIVVDEEVRGLVPLLNLDGAGAPVQTPQGGG
jgi:modulator of FtsH protease HflK